MPESLAPHKRPGGGLLAEKTVLISLPQRRKAPTPNYLDWILHHQIGISPL